MRAWKFFKQNQDGFERMKILNLKLECLETFRAKGSPTNIHALVPVLKNNNEIVRQRTAEVITSLFDKLKSQNQLYDS